MLRAARRSVGIAVASLTMLTGCAPDQPDELVAKARSAIAARDARTADIHLRNALKLDPRNLVAWTDLAGLAETRFDWAGAEAQKLLAEV